MNKFEKGIYFLLVVVTSTLLCKVILTTNYGIVFFYMRHTASMTQRKLDCEEYRRRKRNGMIVYPESLQDGHFHNWFISEVSRAKAAGEKIDEDVLVLSLPPSSQGTSYQSIYVFGNHIRVHSAKGTLTTVDSGVAATFSQNCRSSVRANNVKAANFEYVGCVRPNPPPLSILVRVMVLRITCMLLKLVVV